MNDITKQRRHGTEEEAGPQHQHIAQAEHFPGREQVLSYETRWKYHQISGHCVAGGQKGPEGVDYKNNKFSGIGITQAPEGQANRGSHRGFN